MFRHFLAFALVHSMLLGTLSFSARAIEPAARLLPPSTKGYLSVPDVDRLIEKWNETQLGQLTNDPVMEPFIDDLKRQIRTKLSKTNSALRITWEDLEGVYGGEVCIAVAQPWDADAAARRLRESVEKNVSAARQRGDSEKQIEEIREKTTVSEREAQHRKRLESRGLVLLVDVTDHREAAEELLDKIAHDLAGRDGTSRNVEIAGIDAVIHEFNDDNNSKRRVLYCIHENQLVATDNPTLAKEVLGRLGGGEHDSLADAPAFEASMRHARDAFGENDAQLRWFVEPFGYVEVSRAYEGGRRRRGTDMLQVLANQGFDAVRGAGGLVAFSTNDHEILHHSFVYAPPIETGGEEKYRLAANILDFPNKPLRQPNDWVASSLSSYLTFNWKMKRAFEYVGTLVDEIAGDVVFEDVLKSIQQDPNGPRIDVRKELVQYLADRVVMVSDYREPITVKSERVLFAVEVSDPVAVMKTVNKAMQSDPAARKRDHHGHVVWEILNEDPIEVETVKIDGGFGFGFEEPAVVAEPEKPLIPNSAVTVAYGHLLVGTHIDYLIEILELPATGDRLATKADYVTVIQALEELGLDEDCFQFFTRTDEAYRPTYELMRQGKMPEAETLLGKVLNRIWAPEEEGQLREQHVDGSKMPEYSLVRKYLGPGGFFVHSGQEGWSISGCLLTKAPE